MQKSNKGVSVIGGADGPTSAFLIKQTTKKSLKRYIRNLIYKYRGKRVVKRIVPSVHTLSEVIAYATGAFTVDV